TPTREDAEVEFNRIVAFSDGVFAIAITLLVLTLEVPGGADDLGQELRDRSDEFLAYALSFAVLGKLWLSHHRFFGSLGRFDGTLLALNLLYLAFVALVPFTSDLLGNYSGETVAVIAYALNLAAVSLVFTISVRYASTHDLFHDWEKPHTQRYAGWSDFFVAGVFLISIPVALVSPTAATLVWLAIFFVGRRLGDAMSGHRHSHRDRSR
ncbi:MAG: TMEM175 family protein, partial [Solirubrobacterales bacterium]